MARTRRLAALWGLLAVLAAAAGGLTALSERAGEPPARVSVVPTVTPAPEPVAAPEEPVAEKPRKRRRPRLPRGNGLRDVVRRAMIRGDVERAAGRRWRRDVTIARAAARRLPGARGVELRAVLAELDALAASGRLTVSRMPLAFLTLKRNTYVWRYRPLPRPSQRLTFADDPAVFQYFPGKGVQFHGLATAGRANALAAPCLREAEARRARVVARAQRAAVKRRLGSRAIRRPRARSASRCREGRLARLLDRLSELSSSRGGFTAWEYLFDYGGGSAPWVSAMTQATAAQALARGADALDEARYREVALASLGAFDTAPPVGVRVGARRGREYLMYSFSPGLRIINGYLQSLIGLHDVAELTGSRRAARLFAAGERAARSHVGAYDTGAWSRHSLAGREATLSYHQLVTGFLAGLCERTDREAYCDRAERFERYTREPPRIHLDAPESLREGRPAAVRFWLSKVSSASVRVTNRRGTLLARDGRLPRGSYRYPFTPPRPGRYTLRISAVGPEGRRATEVIRLDAARRPRPKRRRSGPSRGGRAEADGDRSRRPAPRERRRR